jgi:hypothetical protein
MIRMRTCAAAAAFAGALVLAADAGAATRLAT